MKSKKIKFKKPLLIGIVIISIVVIFFSGVMVVKLISKPMPVSASVVEIDVQTIAESIKEISEIVTLSYCYTEIGEYSDQKTLNLFGNDFSVPFGKKSFLITYDGEMKLGVDMSVSSIDVNEINKTITINIPSAKIISHVIKEETVKLFDEKSGLFNKISITDYTNFVTEHKPTIEEKAKNSGLLTQAQENAQTQLQIFLYAIPGVTGIYEINFINS